LPPDTVSVVMWVEDRGQLPLIQARLAEQTFGKPDIQAQKVFSDGRDITWFDRLRARFPDDDSVHAESFVMAVYPSYLKDKFPGLEPQEYGPTREKQFERTYAPDKLLRSITRIALTVDKAEADQLTREFAAYGYTIRDAGEKKIAVGPEFELEMIPVSEGTPRKVAISIKLNHAKEGTQTVRIGNTSDLRFDGDSAIWYFPKPW
jgi:hypothetical protein